MDSYEDYVKIFDALSHPMRIKIAGLISKDTMYVSELAKIMQISRPLLYMHLKKLEEAKLLDSYYEISSTGKTMKFYKLKKFSHTLTSELLFNLSHEIPVPEKKE